MRVWNKLVNWIYPPTCPLCGDVTGRQAGQVCDECRPMIDYPAQPVCMRCGCEITDEEAELCEDCTRHTRTYIQGFPAMKYQYPLDESLARFKYHNQRDYAAFYAGQIVKRHGLTLQSLGIDALIPIPIHKRKLEKRGYNQAELLADALGKKLDIPVERRSLQEARLCAFSSARNTSGVTSAPGVKPSSTTLNAGALSRLPSSKIRRR